MRVFTGSYQHNDSGLPHGYDALKEAAEPMALLKLIAHGSHPHERAGNELEEALLIPVSVIEALEWIANRYKMPPLPEPSGHPEPMPDPRYPKTAMERAVESISEALVCELCEKRGSECRCAQEMFPPRGDTKFIASTDGRWAVDKDYKRQQTVVTLRIPFEEGQGEDERGVRKLISARLNEIGDVLMDLWRKGQAKETR